MPPVNKDYAFHHPRTLYPYSAGDADATYRVYQDYVKPQLAKQDLSQFFIQRSMKLHRNLLKSELLGYKMSKFKAEEVDRQLTRAINRYQRRLVEMSGVKDFNPDSTIQLRKVLFDTFKLEPSGILTDTKLHAVSKKALVLIKANTGHKFIDPLLQFRAIKKLRSTYVRGFMKKMDKRGYIHTSFDLTGSVTGRVTARKPSLPTVPSDTEYNISSKEKISISMQDMFICEDDEIQTYADYSGVELRLLAVLARDKVLLKVFEDGGDPHDKTSQLIFLDEYVKEEFCKCVMQLKNKKAEVCGQCTGCINAALRTHQRRDSKSVNFGIVFGGTPRFLASVLNKPEAIVQGIYDRYMDGYKGVARFMRSIPHVARKDLQITCPYGRIRHFFSIKDDDRFMKGRMARQAVNYLPQGTAAIMMEDSFNLICEQFEKYKMKTWPRNLIYDSITAVGPYKERNATAEIFQEVLSRRVPEIENRGFSFSWGQGSTWMQAAADSKNHEVEVSLKPQRMRKAA